MDRSALIAALAMLLLTVRPGNGLTAQEALGRLRAKLAVEAVTDTSSARLAGQYTSSSEELRRRVGPFLSGNDLYLFPDQSYIYCVWTDIQPVTIFDKGTWRVKDGFLELTTSADVTWKPNLEREYIVVHRASRPDEIVLVGAKDGLSYFEQNAGDDPEFMLLVVSKVRRTPLTRRKSAKLKARLMRESWRPEFFREPAK
jgi:hypothetical protein